MHPRFGAAAPLCALAAAIASGGGGAMGGCDECVGGPRNFGMAAADFDRSGGVDLAAVGTDESGSTFIKVYLRGAGGHYGIPKTYEVAPKDVAIMAADLTGDGLPDLIGFESTDNTGRIPLLFNEPAHAGSFTAGPTLRANGTVNALAVGDLDADGLPDIAVSAGSEIDVFMQRKRGTFSGPVVVSTASTGGAVAIGDLNGDGIADIVFNTSAGITILFQSSTAPGSYQSRPLGTGATVDALFIYIADLNGDGLNDLIVSGPPGSAGAIGSIQVLLQDRHNPGQFLPPVDYPTSGAGDAFNAVVVDLTGGGTGPPDLIVGGTDGVAVLLHDPARPGAFLHASYYKHSDGTGVAVADVNGDGLPDLILPGTNAPQPQVMAQDAAHPGQFLALSRL